MLKKLAKRLLRPLTGPLFWRVQNRIDSAVHRVEVRLDPLELVTVRDVEAIKSYVPALLNAISTQAAAARQLQRRMDELQRHVDAVTAEVAARATRTEQRIEFVRKEMLYEMRYAGPQRSDDREVEPRVVDEEKLASFGDDIRLNLGCGHIPVDGYLNVDGREIPGVDVVADVRRLPFGEGQVSEIYSAHLLEHFPVEELTRSLLPYWFSLLRPGGRFVAVVPDAETMLAEHAAGRMSFEDLREVTFGDQEYEGDFHFNMFSQRSLCQLLEAAGFADAEVTEAARRNGLCYEMEIVARKPARE